jgi:hypothetical protein
MKRMIAGVLLVGALLMFMPARGEQPVAMSVQAPEFRESR